MLQLLLLFNIQKTPQIRFRPSRGKEEFLHACHKTLTIKIDNLMILNLKIATRLWYY